LLTPYFSQFIRIDLVGVPRKVHILALAEFCIEKKEGIEIQWLCSKGDVGKQLWGQFIEGQRIGLGELLTLFPSCRPTLAVLLACSGSMPPRFYSIASSPLLMKDVAVVAFSSVRYTCGLTAHPDRPNAEKPQILKRSGVCTSYLERIITDRLAGMKVDEKVRVFLKPSVTFRLPGSVSPPLILIGPGTGVAPFVGFLQHRAMLEKERKREGGEITTGTWRGGFDLEGEDLPHECNNVGKFIQSTPAGPVSLFFGCRNESDYLYRAQLENWKKDGTLTSLEVAQSRSGPEKIYVTHKLREKGAELAHSVLNEGGYIYICGDGNRMAKDVYTAVSEILKLHGKLSEQQAEDTLDEMKLRRRYVTDIWS
jgi:methionine synthase reductase